MKPTTRISLKGSASFPLTDYHYQSTLDASRAGAKETRAEDRPRGFWRLGTGFFGAEAIRDDMTDFLVFTLVAAMSVWPIVSMTVAVMRMLRN